MTDRFTRALWARYLGREIGKLCEEMPECVEMVIAVAEKSAALARARSEVERLKRQRENALNPIEHEQSR